MTSCCGSTRPDRPMWLYCSQRLFPTPPICFTLFLTFSFTFIINVRLREVNCKHCICKTFAKTSVSLLNGLLFVRHENHIVCSKHFNLPISEDIVGERSISMVLYSPLNRLFTFIKRLMSSTLLSPVSLKVIITCKGKNYLY